MDQATTSNNNGTAQSPAQTAKSLGSTPNSRVSSATTTENAKVSMRASSMTTSKCVTYVSVLFFVNLLNYMDRYTIAGVLTDLQKYFGATDAQGGLLQTVFIIFFMVFAPICGFLGDRYNRKLIMICGLSIWVLAVLASSFVPPEGFWLFILLRGAVGIGEASYSTIAPTILADLFVGKLRSRILMFFYFAIPVGSGLGFIAGSKAASVLGGWQWGVRVTPPLGFIAVLMLAVLIGEPERGMAEREQNGLPPPNGSKALRRRRSPGAVADIDANNAGDEVEANVGDGIGSPSPNTSVTKKEANNSSYVDDLKYLVKKRSYIWVNVGYTTMLFVVGTLSWWAPTAVRHAIASGEGLNDTSLLDNSRKDGISFIFGVITCASGFFGVSAGVILAQLWKEGKFCFRCCPSSTADALISAIGSLTAAPLLYLGYYLIDKDVTAAWFIIFLAVLFLCLNWAIVVDLLMYIIVPWRRNVANSWLIVLSHLFGDASGPYIVGVISDAIRGGSETPAARFHSLIYAFYAANLLLLVSGAAFLMTARSLPADMRSFEAEMADEMQRLHRNNDESHTSDYKSISSNDQFPQNNAEYNNSMFEPD